MITLAWYLLKVIICSGILCGYYFLALRNKAFHRWNRFYLLVAIIISLLAPIIKIDIFQNNVDKGTVVQMLQTISYGDEAVIEYSRNNGFQINTQNIAEGAYLLISAIFLLIFFVSIYKIKRLGKKYPKTKIDDISFINTNAKGTPFSFFKSIFWNKSIDLHSKPGQQIFNHEIAHIKEKHSYDKIFMNLVLIFFWIDPFFWLMRKELNMIHEFVADKEALEDSDINAFAEMILQTVYPGQNFSLTNSFFYSPIKRRILMLRKNKNPKVNYVSRLLVLPLAAIVFFAFTLKVKNRNNGNSYNGKQITVIIAAGHGGADNGASTADIKEKDITLAIAKQIKKLNNNENINIILTRDEDEFLSVHDQAKFADVNKADVFISIHLAAESKENLHSGMDIFVPLDDNKYLNQSKLLGSSIIQSFKNNYPLKVATDLKQRERGLVVLNENPCPAIVIETGFLTTVKDRNYLTKTQNQQTVARDILNGIENYAMQEAQSNIIVPDATDTIPPMYYHNKKVTGLEVQSESYKIKVTKPVIKVTYEDGTKEMISKEEADKRNFILPPPPPPAPGLPPHYFNTKNLIIINGKASTNAQVKNLDPNKIKSITILKQNEAIKKYGDKGKNGVIEIITKNKNGNVTIVNTDAKTIHGNSFSAQRDTAPRLQLIGKVFAKTEIAASFPGGQQAWIKYISHQIQASLDSFTNADFGTCVVRFVVGVDGSVIGEEAITMKGTHLAKMAVNAIKNGPKWIPAKQNGHDVAAYRLQPVTLITPDKLKNNSTQSEPPIIFTPPARKIDDEKVFTKIEQPASFPGGQRSWLRYISRVFDKNGNELMSDKNNLGTCKVRFVVSKDGEISNVEPLTMKGTQLADVAVNAIEKGPRWNPGKQNGYAVNSYVMVPVTFKLSDNLMNKNEPE